MAKAKPAPRSKTRSKQKSSPAAATKSAPRSARPRTLSAPKRTLLRPRTWRRPKVSYTPLPKARQLLRASLIRLKESRKAILGITLIYGIGVVLLVRGFSATQDFVTLRNLLDSLLTGSFGKIQSIGLQLTVLFGGSGTTNTPNGGVYQTILMVVCSLALIWVFRQAQAKKPVGTKRAFYQGMYPVIPFLLVLLIIGLQLLPMSIGSYLYTTLINTGIAVHTWEKLLSLAVFLLLSLWSLRMLTGSMFALYIVTLPDMAPLRAIRSAKQLVKGRRLLIWRKLLLLPAVIVIGTSLLVLPFLVFLTPVVVWVFFFISTLWFALIHSYLYTLYRELLNHA